MDVTLPGIDGTRGDAPHPRAAGPPAAFAIVGISGRGESADEAAGRAAGMDDYLAKPLSPSSARKRCSLKIDQRSQRTTMPLVGRRLHDPHDVGHDAVDLEILGRVDGGHAGVLERAGILGRDDAADHDRDVPEPGRAHARDHVLHQRHVRAGQDRQADTCAPCSRAAATISAGVRRMPS